MAQKKDGCGCGCFGWAIGVFIVFSIFSPGPDRAPEQKKPVPPKSSARAQERPRPEPPKAITPEPATKPPDLPVIPPEVLAQAEKNKAIFAEYSRQMMAQQEQEQAANKARLEEITKINEEARRNSEAVDAALRNRPKGTYKDIHEYREVPSAPLPSPPTTMGTTVTTTQVSPKNTVFVDGYIRKDGTTVSAHTRSAPGSRK